MTQALFVHKSLIHGGRWDFYHVHRQLRKAVKVIISVVLGALLLAAIVLIFNGTVIPRITQEINALFR